MGVALALAVAGSLLAAAGPASAAVPGLVQVNVTTETSMGASKQVSVNCPAGKVLVGSGYGVNGATDGEIVVERILPRIVSGTVPTQVQLIAFTEDLFTANWSVTVFAICANPLPGMERVTVTSALDPAEPKFATATCPAGKVLLGGGFAMLGGNGNVVVDDFRPNGSSTTAPTSVTVGAYEADPDYTQNWSITAHAICANPVPGLVRIAASSGLSSDGLQQATASCQDKVLTGTGFEINGATGEAVVDDFRPNGSATTAPTSILARAFEADPFSGNWQVTSYAICATR